MPRVHSHTGFLKILLLAALFLFFTTFAGTVDAKTVVNSNITSNTTWSSAGSPYLIQNNITVATGTTLTIGAGTVVKFAEQNGIRINGTLLVKGTASKKVYFTSIKDDAVGGDSNGDGVATKPAAEDWKSIFFAPGSIGTMSYPVIRYAGYAWSQPDASPAIYNDGGTVTINNGAILSNFSFGIGQIRGKLKVSSSTIRDNTFGVAIKGGAVELVGNVIENSFFGVADDGDSTLVLTRNTFKNNVRAVDFYFSKQRSILETANITSGNTYNGIVLSGPVTKTFSLSASKGLSYVIVGGSGSDHGSGRLTFKHAPLSIARGGHLKVAAGTVVKLDSLAKLPVEGTLTVSGSVTSPVVFTSLYDSAYGNKTWSKSSRTAAMGDWGDISVKSKGVTKITNAILRYGGESQYNSGSIVSNNGGTLSISYSSIAESNNFGVRHQNGTTTLRYNNIVNNINQGVYNDTTKAVDARYNYWGDPAGPYHSKGNPKGFGAMVSDNVTFKSFSTAPNSKTSALPCCSSILFLPGIMGTRLFDASTGKKLWEPAAAADISNLYMKTSGTSINPNVVVGSVIDEFSYFGNSVDVNIYKSFLADLGDAKSRGLINEFDAYGYDWRKSLADILKNGQMVNSVKYMAKNSKTGKVTIVAHSNGGLLAKALINQLGAESETLVDDLVLVGVPQVGTPQAIGAMLHGFQSGLPYDWLTNILTKEQARAFASTSPAMYNLLPHDDYFANMYYNRSGVDIYDRPVVFEPGKATDKFISLYGTSIDTRHELYRFLYGEDKRGTPSYSNLTAPSKLYKSLLDKSGSEIFNISGSWTAPSGVRVHQVAGVGVLTPYQIKYSTNLLGKLQYNVARTVDGDKTVVEPSALAMSTSSHMVRRLWVDLEGHNGPSRKDRTHSNILEVLNLRTFIFDNVVGTSTSYSYDFLSRVKPKITGGNRLTFTLHSPLSLSYTESDGTVVNAENPYGRHAQFSRYGEIQIIDVFNGGKGEIQLDGEDSGHFTLGIEEAQGDTVLATAVIDSIPTTANTRASIGVNGQTVSSVGVLKVDYEGDGTIDFSITPAKSDTKTIGDAVSTSPSANSLLNSLRGSGIDLLTPVVPIDDILVEPDGKPGEELSNGINNN